MIKIKLRISTDVDLTDEYLDKWYRHYARPDEYRWEWGDDTIICAKTKDELRKKIIEFLKKMDIVLNMILHKMSVLWRSILNGKR